MTDEHVLQRNKAREKERERVVLWYYVPVHVSLPVLLFRVCCAPVWRKVTLPTTKPTTLFQYNNKPTPHAAHLPGEERQGEQVCVQSDN